MAGTFDRNVIRYERRGNVYVLLRNGHIVFESDVLSDVEETKDKYDALDRDSACQSAVYGDADGYGRYWRRS